MPEKKTRFCSKCRKTMDVGQFYTSWDTEKYSEGYLNECKKCISMHVDNFNPDTYTWILKECDVPYLPEEWSNLLLKYAQDPTKITGLTILGRYLAKMRLKQYKDYRWKDSEFLLKVAAERLSSDMKNQGYSAADIAQAVQESSDISQAANTIKASLSTLNSEELETVALANPSLGIEISHIADESEEDYFAIQSGGTDDFHNDLTEEDKLYLRLKWGKSYKPEEWIRLEQLYEEMSQSYDIQGAGHVDTLKLLCKTSLKANQLIDISDVEGFQKMSKVYDQLMKSGNFTAVQNKQEKGDFIDSIGELIEMCEKQGYIEKYYIDQPKDRVDLTIQDMQRYTKTLIEDETNLTILVEKALQENQKEDENSKNDNGELTTDDDLLGLEEIEAQLKEEDYTDFSDFLEEQRQMDADFFEEED